MRKITFEDKIPIQIDGTIARKNKITADDINEIKDVINTNAELMQANISKAETLQEDISNIKDEQKKQSEDIESNKTINEENSNSINAVLNAMPTVRSEEEQVTLENTIDFKFKKLKIKGNSKQETRSGKNKIAFEDIEETNLQGITYQIKKDSVKLNGTATGVSNIYSNAVSLTAGQYILSVKVSGTFNIGKGTSSPAILLQKKQNDGSYNTVNGFEISANNPSKTVTATLEEGIYRLRIFTATDNVLNNLTWSAQLEEGKITTEIEPHGKMPSLEHQSEVQNVKENIRINIRNKNFCDLDILEKIKGKAITINSSNSFTINLTDGGMGVTTGINIMLPDGIDKSKKYRIKYHRKMNNTSFLPYLKVLYVDGNIDGVNDRNLEADYEYVTNGKELSVITLAWNTQSQGGIVTFSNISITEINENSDFEESKKQLIIFPLAENQKLMKDDYLAEDGIHHKRKQIVLDEKSFIGLYNHANVDSEMQGFYTSVDGVILNSKIVSSHFKNDSLFETKENRIYCYQSNTIYFIVNKTVADNIDKLKTYLISQKEAGTPVVIEYELAEEQIETYTEEQQKAYEQIKNAKSYDGQTNIYCDNETSAIIEAEAYANINSIINNLQAQIISNASEGV